MSTIVADFDANPKTFVGETKIRFIDKSIATGTTVTGWSWSSSVGTFNSTTVQNPILTVVGGSDTTINVTLTATGSDTTTDSETKTAFLTRKLNDSSKPTVGGYYGNISIFLYSGSSATIINMNWSTNNNLFFRDLTFNCAIDKMSTARFLVVDAAKSSATERSLLTANTNVAIIMGKQVVWSGKIRKATQGNISAYNISTPYQTFSVECVSDISKMESQPIKAANIGTYTASPGYIVSKLVEAATANDINWLGVAEDSYITYEGSDITYEITDGDMYTQFISLAKVCGWDWRTRNDWRRYSGTYYNSVYGVGYPAFVFSTYPPSPYTTSNYVGYWVILYGSTNIPTSYGYVTAAPDSSAVTMTVTNEFDGIASVTALFIGTPVLDFSSDLGQITPVGTLYQNYETQAVRNCYQVSDKSDYKMIATKIVAKGKSSTEVVPGTNTKKTVYTTLVAKDAWDDDDIQFENTTYITRKTDGDILYIQNAAKHIYLKGVNYALQSGDKIYVIYTMNDGTKDHSAELTISSVTEYATGYDGVSQTSDIPCTDVLVDISQVGIPQYATQNSFVLSEKIYVRDYSRVTQVGATTDVWVGAEQAVRTITNASCGNDAVYGNYLYVNSISDVDETEVFPHLVGCPISNDTYSESSAQTGSPLDMFGLITKTFTPDQNITKQDLEIYILNALVNHSYYYRKGSTWCLVYDWYKDKPRSSTEDTYYNQPVFIEAGDKICILQKSGDSIDDTEFGQYNNRWQVVSYSFDSNSMRVTVELGDFERNLFNLINDRTISINLGLT